MRPDTTPRQTTALQRLALCSLVCLSCLLSACGGGGGDSAPAIDITAQPLSTAVVAGQTVVLSITADGDGLRFQWQLSTDGGNTWTDIAGAIAATYDLGTVSTALNGTLYRVLITDARGASLRSEPATLSVAASAGGPAIATQPASAIASAGGGAAFSVVASGPVQSYQWQLSIDGGLQWADIAGAIEARYLLALVRAYMSGWQYRVVIVGAGGTSISSAATLTLGAGEGSALAGFASAAEGQQPTGTPVLARDGNLYGTTYAGGAQGGGTLFKVTPAGVRTLLHSFGSGSGSDGSVVLAGLVQGADGHLYGTTSNGGTSNIGTVFRATTDGVVTVLYSFPGGAAGAVPYGGVIMASDGNLYGTTFFGGSNNLGTIFRVTPAGVATVLHSFGAAGDGQAPKSEPMQAADGNLYGVAGLGGANGRGMVYRLSLSGDYTLLYSFGAAPDGRSPLGRLLQAADGNFYGTTYNGGANDAGTVFRLTPEGSATVLHSFGGPGDGISPYAGLTTGRDGQLYGTTNGGGANGRGTVFRISLAGIESVLHSFAGTSDGQNPTAGLVQAANGALYGVCQLGGDGNLGTVFELMP